MRRTWNVDINRLGPELRRRGIRDVIVIKQATNGLGLNLATIHDR